MTKFETRNSKFESSRPFGPVRDFKDLITWKLARELRIQIYVLVRKFPGEELYALNSQLRRAAQSIGANIAEGFGRYSYRENIQFCRQARGSVFEVRDHLMTALDAGFISNDEYTEANALAQRMAQTLNGYIRATNKRLTNSAEE
jgi:four helix bundle protein